MIYDLPNSLSICGTEYEIRTDFREILGIFEILNNAELTEQERGFLALLFFYRDFQNMPTDHYQEAIRKLFWFINGGDDSECAESRQKVVDWEQDFKYIVAPINKTLGYEVRAIPYNSETNTGGVHWWTFLSAYMEIGDCTFSQIVRIRSLRAKGKKLDKADQEFYKKNRHLVDFKHNYTDAENDILKKMGVK